MRRVTFRRPKVTEKALKEILKNPQRHFGDEIIITSKRCSPVRMPFASKCNTSSSTHYIFIYININAIHLSTFHCIETLTHYGKNEDYGESAFWFVQILSFSCLIRTKRLMGPGWITRQSRRKRDVSFGLINSINGTKLVGNTLCGVPKQKRTVPYTVTLSTNLCV